MNAAIYALTAVGVTLLVWYYIVCFQAERPRCGTLEWIDFYDRPKTALLSCGKRMTWADALWALIPAAVAAASVVLAKKIGIFYDFAPGAAAPGVTGLEAASIGIIGGADGPTVIYLTAKLVPHLLSAVLSAASAYLLLKTLTGQALAALAGALLYAVGAEDGPTSCLLFSGLLFFWLWAGFPRSKGLGLFFLCLGSFLLGAGSFCFGFPAILLSLICALLFALIRHMREEALGAGSFLLFLFAALFSAALGFGVIFVLAALGVGLTPFSAGSFAFMKEAAATRIALLPSWLRVPKLDLRLLFEFAALVSALVPLWTLWRRRRESGALFLLIWALPLTLLYGLIPVRFPIVPAALICGWLTGRLLHRGHPFAALFGAVGGIAAYTLTPLLLQFIQNWFHF